MNFKSIITFFLIWMVLPLSNFGGTLVQFRIYAGGPSFLGQVDVELYDKDKPITVQNFLTYVKGGVYSNNFFNRCVPFFVLQGGAANAVNRFDTNLFTSFNLVTTLPPITNEYYVGPIYSNTFGTIAMATSTSPDTATSAFFFNLADNSTTFGQPSNHYAVFGHVVRGTNILALFNGLSPNGGGIVNMTTFYGDSEVTRFLANLPVNYIGNTPPRTIDLIYVDISLVNLQIAKTTNNQVQISWNSVTGVTNRVEYTTNFPPNWQLLVSTNGNGLPMSVTDSATNKPGRFYRVHVLY